MKPIYSNHRKKKPSFYFSILCFCLLNLFSFYGQDKYKSDSLLLILKHHKNISINEKIVLLNTLACYHPKNDTVLLILKQALKLSAEINTPILEAETWEEIVYAEKRLGNSVNSLNAAFKALTIYESLSLKKEQAASYAQIAAHYTSEKEYTSAIFYLEKSNKIYFNSKNTLKQTFTLLNLGELYRLSGSLEKSEVTFLKVLELNKVLKEKDIEGYTLGNLGMIYNTKNNLKSADKNLKKAIKILDKLGDSYASAIYLNELGNVYEKQKKVALAKQNFTKAFQIAKNHNFKEEIRDFSKKLAIFHKNEKQFKEAFEYQELFQKYQDSLVNKTNVQKIEQVKSKYQIAKKETEISLLNTINKNQKTIVIVLVLGLSLVLLLSYFLYKGYLKTKKSNELLISQKNVISKKEQEKAILLKELNHRTKNNLQMISSLLNLQSNKLAGHPAKEAILSGKHRVDALSLVHRKLYQDGVDSKIKIKDYIEELVLDLFYGYDVNFSPKLSIDNVSIHIDTAVPLALIINELIINALKYAYIDIKNPELEITINEKKNNYLSIDIKDNGIGYNQETQKKQHSFGLKLLNSLIQQLNGSIQQILSTGTHWKIEIKTT